jgi:hypothetical protein
MNTRMMPSLLAVISIMVPLALTSHGCAAQHDEAVSQTQASPVLDSIRELPLALQQGVPALAITYAYDSDFAWSIRYTSSLTSAQINTLPVDLSWNVEVPVASGATEILANGSDFPRQNLLTGTVAVTDPTQVKQVLLKQREASVVFYAPEGGSLARALYKLSLSSLCARYPTHVKDLTKTSAPACVVDPKDLDIAPRCIELRREYTDLVKQGLLPCAIAKSSFAREGCGEFSCQ